MRNGAWRALGSLNHALQISESPAAPRHNQQRLARDANNGAEGFFGVVRQFSKGRQGDALTPAADQQIEPIRRHARHLLRGNRPARAGAVHHHNRGREKARRSLGNCARCQIRAAAWREADNQLNGPRWLPGARWCGAAQSGQACRASDDFSARYHVGFPPFLEGSLTLFSRLASHIPATRFPYAAEEALPPARAAQAAKQWRAPANASQPPLPRRKAHHPKSANPSPRNAHAIDACAPSQAPIPARPCHRRAPGSASG